MLEQLELDAEYAERGGGAGGVRNCVTGGTKGRSHVLGSRRRPTIPKLSAHTTTTLSMTNAYTALTTHGPCGATIHHGIWHFCTFCEQRH